MASWRTRQTSNRDYEGDIIQKQIVWRKCIEIGEPFRSQFDKRTLQRLHVDHGGFVMEELAKKQLDLIDAWGHGPFDGFSKTGHSGFTRSRDNYLRSVHFMKNKGLFGPGKHLPTVEIKSCLSKKNNNSGINDKFGFTNHQVGYASVFGGQTIGIRFLTDSTTMLQLYLCPDMYKSI